MRLHHVQVSCPPGGEDAARRFYAHALGMTEVDKPEALRGRGGVWFRFIGPSGAVLAELHVGVEERFAPALKAHPALWFDDLAGLDVVVARVAAGGWPVDHTQRSTLPGFVRVHVADPHGNRIELLATEHPA